MKRSKMLGVGKTSRGYTIIEALIFLAVSGALLISATTLISGRQERTRFSQEVDNVANELQDLFNDVATGYYPNADNIRCTYGAGAISVTTTGPNSTGTNEQCVFSGKFIDFKNGAESKFESYTVVSNTSANAFTTARNELIGIAGNEGIFDTKSNNINLKAVKIVEKPPAVAPPSAPFQSLVVVSDFGNSSGGSLSGNASMLTLYKYSASASEFLTNLTLTKVANNSEIIICLQQDGNTGRYGTIKITPQLTFERIIGAKDPSC